MTVNPFLSIAGFGMITTGLLAMILWWRRSKVEWKYFLMGAIVWVAAILVKAVMDLTVTTILVEALNDFGIAIYLIIIGVYIGLRTGLLESGFSYFAALIRLRNIGWNEAFAFGIGFGGVEAIVLGLQNISLLVFYFNPSLVELLPEAMQKQLSMPTIIVLAPVLERVFTLAVHILTTLLAIYSAITGKFKYLMASIFYKTLLDGIVPALPYLFDITTVQGMYLAEAPIAAIGVTSFLIIRSLEKSIGDFKGCTHTRPSTPLK
ncbi:MAG: YhfC family glutamic-type intramembrane protease [Nitrososphaeria archaeon]